MIIGELNVKIIFNKEDEKKIIDATQTMNEIISAFKRVGNFTESYEKTLMGAVAILNQILLGEMF